MSKFSLKCWANSRRTNMLHPWPPWTRGMQSLTPMPAYWAPAGWQSYIGLMMPARLLGVTLDTDGFAFEEFQRRMTWCSLHEFRVALAMA